VPQDPNLITMYTCGPTVYDYVTIGNFRTYTLGDLIYRVLDSRKYKIKYVMNLTDVGHLTGDNEGDADTGDDRIEKSAEKEGKSAREIADFYINDFLKSFEELNLEKPSKFARATDYIGEQIELVKKLERGGFTYETSDGVYFDTSRYPDYGKLSGLTAETVKEGARVEVNPEKKHPTDFALWKFSPKDTVRWQEWESPWGRGFPGWHLECSAMAMKELGETVDIHLGGEDLRMVHHQNEIAQSECATGKQFVRYWVHGAFLQVDGGRMSKSKGNAYTLADLKEKGYDPIALRYLFMSAHYRTPLNFTWDALNGAQIALKKLYSLVGDYREEGGDVDDDFMEGFENALDEDLNIPKTIALVWDLLKSDLPEATKLVTLLKVDEILGLNIADYVGYEIPKEVVDLAKIRQEYRKTGIWDKADLMRKQIEAQGFLVEDKGDGFKIKRKL